MKIGVIGCGFVGLISSLGFASKGYEVTAVDIDESRVEKISKGIVPFHEPGVERLLKKCLKNKSFKVSASMEEIGDCDILFLCVQTPSKKSGAIDLSILKNAAEAAAYVFAARSKKRVVVIRSTVVPGTTENLIASFFKKTKGSNRISIAFNPEFLREGSALDDFLNPDRVVIGTNSKRAGTFLSEIYRAFKCPIILTSFATAELSKYTSNVLLATLVSFSNEIARICEHTPGTDIEDVLHIIHEDRRFKASKNRKEKIGILSYLKAGCGFGGSCLPKDLSALISYAKISGLNASLLKAVESVNITQSGRVVDMAEKAVGKIAGNKVAVLGAAFKGGTDDLRHSPGLRITDELLKRKAKVLIYDPIVKPLSLQNYFKKGVIIANSLEQILKEVNVCIVASNAPEFYSFGGRKKNIKIIDGRRILKIHQGENSFYYGVGRHISQLNK